MQGEIFAFGEFELDATWRELRRSGTVLQTPAVVLRVIEALVTAAPEGVSREHLLAQVWKNEPVGYNTLTTAIARARALLGHKRGVREFIATSRQKGYRFLPAVARIGGPPALAPATRLPDRRSPRAIVGRGPGLLVLRRSMHEARSGRGGLCIIKGERGIGKSYLVESFEEELSKDDACVAWGYCRAAGDTPSLWPWLRIIRSLYPRARQLIARTRAQPLLHELERLRTLIDVHARSANAQANLTANEDLSCEQLYAIITRLLLLVANHAPLLLVLEDLHHADPGSLDMLAHLLVHLHEARVLVVATLRPMKLRTADHAALSRLHAHPRSSGIALDRLAEPDVGAYVTEVAKTSDRDLARAIFAESNGDPYLMAELTRWWLLTGRSDPTDASLAEVARECVQDRTLVLAPAARHVLLLAAVVGPSFDVRLLAAITAMSEPQLTANLDEAIAAGLCVAAPGTRSYTFVHESHRRVLYRELSPAVRRAWHLRIASALVEQARAGAAIPPRDIAQHFYEALPDTDLHQTVHWCREAARAAATSGHREAMLHTRRALEALSMLPEPSVPLRMQLLDTLCLFARSVDAALYRASAHSLVRLALVQQDARMLVRGALMLNQHPGLQPLEGAVEALERALEALPERALGLRACALAALAVAPPLCFSERAYGMIDEAVALSRAAKTRSCAYVALLHQAHLYGGPAHGRRAHTTLNDVEELALKNARTMPMLAVDVALHRAVAGLQKADHGAVRSALDGALIRARRQGNAELLWHVSRVRALAKLNVGRAAQGGQQLEALQRQADAQQLFGTRVFCAFDQAVSMRSFRILPAPLAARRKDFAYEASEPPNIWAMKLRALATVGLLEEARETLQVVRAPEMLAQLPCDINYLGTLGHLAHAVVRLGARDYAAVMYDLLAPYDAHFAAQQSFHCEGAVPQVRGLLAHALGRYDDAIALLARGIVMNDRVGFGPAAVVARLDLARCLCDRARPDDLVQARQLLGETHRRAERLGMYGLLAELGEFSRASGIDVAAHAHEDTSCAKPGLRRRSKRAAPREANRVASIVSSRVSNAR